MRLPEQQKIILKNKNYFPEIVFTDHFFYKTKVFFYKERGMQNSFSKSKNINCIIYIKETQHLVVESVKNPNAEKSPKNRAFFMYKLCKSS